MAQAKRKASKEEQAARFVRAAVEAGVDESGAAFERVFKKVVRPRRKPRRPNGNLNKSVV